MVKIEDWDRSLKSSSSWNFGQGGQGGHGGQKKPLPAVCQSCQVQLQSVALINSTLPWLLSSFDVCMIDASPAPEAA